MRIAFRFSRLRMLALSTGLTLAAGSLPACHKKAADRIGQAAPDPETIKQSFIALKKQFAEMQQSFADLRKEVEGLPPDLRGYPQLRARFYQAEEVRGVLDAKATVLSGQLDAALQSGKVEELQRVAAEIANTSNDARQLGEQYVKLLHEVMAFQRAAQADPRLAGKVRSRP